MTANHHCGSRLALAVPPDAEPRPRRIDRAAVQRAARDLLRAVGADVDAEALEETPRRVADAGIDLDAVTAQVEREGVRSYCDSYQDVLDCIESKLLSIDGGPLLALSGARRGRGLGSEWEADMPNGIFPVPPFDSSSNHAAGTRPSLAVRFQTWSRRHRLDEELAAGADPETTAELGLRASQLRSPAERSRLANALAETLGEARRGTPVTIRARPQRAEVRATAEELLALVGRLRNDQPVGVRGAAHGRPAAERPSEPSLPRRRTGTATRDPRCARCPRRHRSARTPPGSGSLA